MARLTVVLLLVAARALAQTAPVPPPRPQSPAAAGPETPAAEAERAAAQETPGAAAAPSAAGETGPEPAAGPVAILRGLDKFSGVTERLVAPVGAPLDYGRLVVTVDACRIDPEEGAVAHLVIVDRKRPDPPAFLGWMFAESPALSALDHPRYDVWLADCST